MGRKIVLATGKFANIHPGHVELFEYCSTLGSVVVGVNTDDYIMKQYGKIPIPLVDRIYLIKSIRYVDYVFAFSEENACKLIERIHPHVFVKGSDYLGQEIPEMEVCRDLHIKYLVAPLKKKYDTSKLLDLK